jgi:hypothetical protein
MRFAEFVKFFRHEVLFLAKMRLHMFQLLAKVLAPQADVEVVVQNNEQTPWDNHHIFLFQYALAELLIIVSGQLYSGRCDRPGVGQFGLNAYGVDASSWEPP